MNILLVRSLQLMEEERFNVMEVILLSKKLKAEGEKVAGFFRNMSRDDYAK